MRGGTGGGGGGSDRFSVIDERSVRSLRRRQSLLKKVETEPQQPVGMLSDEWHFVFAFINFQSLRKFFRPVCRQFLQLVNESVVEMQVSSRTFKTVRLSEFPFLQVLVIAQLNQSGFKKVCKELTSCAYMTKLSIEFCKVEDNIAKALAACLPKLHRLQELRIDSSHFSKTALTILALTLPQIASLRCLSLADDALKAQSVSILWDVLPSCAHLQTVDLSDNYLGNKGAFRVAEVALASTTLKAVALGGNRIGDSGAIPLAQLCGGGRLSSLDLSDNDITDGGARAFLEVLEKDPQQPQQQQQGGAPLQQQSCAFEFLDLESNHFKEEIFASFKKRAAERHLDLRVAQISMQQGGPERDSWRARMAALAAEDEEGVPLDEEEWDGDEDEEEGEDDDSQWGEDEEGGSEAQPSSAQRVPVSLSGAAGETGSSTRRSVGPPAAAAAAAPAVRQTGRRLIPASSRSQASRHRSSAEVGGSGGSSGRRSRKMMSNKSGGEDSESPSCRGSVSEDGSEWYERELGLGGELFDDSRGERTGVGGALLRKASVAGGGDGRPPPMATRSRGETEGFAEMAGENFDASMPYGRDHWTALLMAHGNEDDNDGQSEEEDSDFDPGDGEGDAESASEEEAEAEGVQGGGGASEDEDEAEWEEEASSSEGEETEYTSTATTSRYLHSHSYRSGSSAGVGGGRSAGATALIPSTGRTRKGGTRDQSARATPMGFETVERGRRRRPYGLTSAAPFTAPLSAHQSDSGLPALRGKGGRVGVLSSSRPPSEAPASSSLTRHHSGVGCREGGGEGGVDAEEMEDSGEAGMEHQDRGARGEMHPNPPTNVPLLNAQTIFPMDPPSPVLPSLQPVGLRGVKRKKADDKEGGGEGIEEGEGEGVKKEEIPPEGPECDALSDSHTRDPREHTTQSPHKGQLAAGPVSDQIPFPFLRRSPRVSSGGREGQTNRGGEERNRKSRKVNNSRGELAEERTATPFPRAAAAAAAAAAGGISLSSSVVPSISFPSVSERRAFRGRSRTANCPSGPTGVDTAAASRSAWVVQRDLLEGEGEEDEDGDDSDFDFDCADDSEEEEGSDGLEDEEEGWGGIGTGERGLMRTRLLHGELGAFGGGEAEMEEEEDFGVGEFEEDFGEELSLLLADAEAHGEGDFLFASVGGRGEDSVAGRTRRASREMGGPSSSSSSSSSSASSSSSSSSSSSVSSSSSSSSSASSSSSSSSSSFSSSSSSSSSSSAAAAVLEPSSHSPTAPLPPLESSQKTPLTAVGQVADSPAPPGTDGGRGCKGSLRGTADPLTECLWEKPQPHEAARGTAPAPSPPAPPPSQALSGVSTSGPASPSPEGLTHQAHPQQNEGVTGEPTAAAAAKQMDESMFDGSREA